MLKENQTIILYMNDGVPCGEFKSILEAYRALKENKETDKRENIKGNNYYFELEEERNNATYTWELKIYKRKNRIYTKVVESQEHY